ncbi:MAG: hypothetical protein L6R35_003278 [Caloplaca aegaea]|nr:MAG: hypothetical protein L6R35_003278 [Caloplaca aegaea]
MSSSAACGQSLGITEKIHLDNDNYRKWMVIPTPEPLSAGLKAEMRVDLIEAWHYYREANFRGELKIPWLLPVDHYRVILEDECGKLTFGAMYEEWRASYPENRPDMEYGHFLANPVRITATGPTTVSGILEAHRSLYSQASALLAKFQADAGLYPYGASAFHDIFKHCSVTPLYPAIVLVVDRMVNKSDQASNTSSDGYIRLGKIAQLQSVLMVRTGQEEQLSAPISFASIRDRSLPLDRPDTIGQEDDIIRVNIATAVQFITALERREVSAKPDTYYRKPIQPALCPSAPKGFEEKCRYSPEAWADANLVAAENVFGSPIYEIIAGEPGNNTKTLYAHADVLSKSTVLKAAVQGSFIENKEQKLTWSHWTIGGAEKFLEWLYTGDYKCPYPMEAIHGRSTSQSPLDIEEAVEPEHVFATDSVVAAIARARDEAAVARARDQGAFNLALDEEQQTVQDVPAIKPLRKLQDLHWDGLRPVVERISQAEEYDMWPGHQLWSPSDLDYKATFMTHAELYVMARHYMLNDLQNLTWRRLRAVLTSIGTPELDTPVIANLVTLASYVYEHTADADCDGDDEEPLRMLVSTFSALHFTAIKGVGFAASMLSEKEADRKFVVDLMTKVGRQMLYLEGKEKESTASSPTCKKCSKAFTVTLPTESHRTYLTMENEKGELVDLYVPRKCSATNRIIKAKDHASVQISVGKVDENGRYTGENVVYALCGFVRAMGEGDDSLNRLAQRDGLVKGVWSGQRVR